MQNLDNIELLADLSPEIRAALATKCVWRVFQNGEQILERSTTSRDVFFVAEGSVNIVKLDVADPSSIERCVGELEGQADSLHVLINNAGIFGGTVEQPLPQTTQLGLLAMDEMLGIFRVNTIAPVLVAQACFSLLKNSASAPAVRTSALTCSAFSMVERRSRCTPAIFQPPRASSTAVAPPKPLDAPRISAHPFVPAMPATINFPPTARNPSLI